MISTLIYLLVLLLCIGVIWWVLDYIPVPEPLNRLAKIVVVVLGALAIIMVLLNLTGVHVPVPTRP
jgi:hypothetical protein